MRYWLANEADTRAAGAALAGAILPMAKAAPVTVFIRGDLGAGKSTLVRGFLSAAGISGVMPSPTYTLVEPYRVNGINVFHMDAYRLSDAAELDFLGLEEATEPGSVLLVEWPDRILDALPPPTISLDLKMTPRPDGTVSDESSDVLPGEAVQAVDNRCTQATAQSSTGRTTADPGRLLTVELDALKDEDRDRLVAQEGWQKLTKVVT